LPLRVSYQIIAVVVITDTGMKLFKRSKTNDDSYASGVFDLAIQRTGGISTNTEIGCTLYLEEFKRH
jgi:hypothetical protein